MSQILCGPQSTGRPPIVLLACQFANLDRYRGAGFIRRFEAPEISNSWLILPARERQAAARSLPGLGSETPSTDYSVGSPSVRLRHLQAPNSSLPLTPGRHDIGPFIDKGSLRRLVTAGALFFVVLISGSRLSAEARRLVGICTKVEALKKKVRDDPQSLHESGNKAFIVTKALPEPVVRQIVEPHQAFFDEWQSKCLATSIKSNTRPKALGRLGQWRLAR